MSRLRETPTVLFAGTTQLSSTWLITKHQYVAYKEGKAVKKQPVNTSTLDSGRKGTAEPLVSTNWQIWPRRWKNRGKPYVLAVKLKESGIPILAIETDYGQEDTGQLKTRIEAFFCQIENGGTAVEKTKILVVDDERKIREVVRMYLENEGFAVGEATDGREALNLLTGGKWDLLILDLMMPGVDGWSVCREVRKTTALPIIMLTARDAEVDRIVGLELGADDYVVKPFSPRELVARVKAVLRRSQIAPPAAQDGKPVVLNYPGLSINPESRLVLVNEQPVNLTPKEYDMLYLMARSPSRTFTREELIESVWGYDYFGDTRTVDTHVNRLRDKLQKASGYRSYISTVWGVGYKFEVDK
ncbi:MAG: response regulator [Pelotomaculum sp.]|nr:response regulator [Pelotomaculum sp.]